MTRSREEKNTPCDEIEPALETVGAVYRHGEKPATPGTTTLSPAATGMVVSTLKCRIK